MAKKGFHGGGFVHVAPRPLIGAVEGEAVDRMNDGAVTVTVTVDNAATVDRRIAEQVSAAMGVPQRLLGRDQ